MHSILDMNSDFVLNEIIGNYFIVEKQKRSKEN